MEPDDGSLTYCLIRSFNSMARGLREWSSILTTGKLSNGRAGRLQMLRDETEKQLKP